MTIFLNAVYLNHKQRQTIMKTLNNITTSVYEIKINGKWDKVRATSMMALNTYCESLGIKGWRAVGMMSIAELRESQSLEVVA